MSSLLDLGSMSEYSRAMQYKCGDLGSGNDILRFSDGCEVNSTEYN